MLTPVTKSVIHLLESDRIIDFEQKAFSNAADSHDVFMLFQTMRTQGSLALLHPANWLQCHMKRAIELNNLFGPVVRSATVVSNTSFF
jgi:hypothetical protein